MATIIGLHHAQVCIPTGEEAAGRAFYCEALGLPEIAKPESLAGRGGFWLQVGDREVHIGTEDGVDYARSKAHLAYEVADLDAWRERLESHGITVGDSIPIPGYVRFEVRDPFGNRVELVQASD
jgi:catechol 2,3-dioxygenase-like lactoylglutathione lyase family enzyme